MRATFCVLLFACGRHVWQAPDPNSRAAVLASRVGDLVASVKTPRGQWFNGDRNARFPVNQVRAAYLGTVVLRLADQRKLRTDAAASDFILDAPGSVRDLLVSGDAAAMAQVIKAVTGQPANTAIDTEVSANLKLVNTVTDADTLQTSVNELVTFGHALGEGSLLLATTQGERLQYGEALQFQDALVGYSGDSCAVFHDSVGDVTIAIFGPAEVAAQLYADLH